MDVIAYVTRITARVMHVTLFRSSIYLNLVLLATVDLK